MVETTHWEDRSGKEAADASTDDAKSHDSGVRGPEPVRGGWVHFWR
jgi:hypothetical protein